MISSSLFDNGPEIEFPSEIMCSRFHPTTQNLFMAGAISGHLHWFESYFCCKKNQSFIYPLCRLKINDEENQRTMSIERSMKVHKKSVRAIGLTPDGQSIVTVSKDKSIKLRSTETGKITARYKRAHRYSIFVILRCYSRLLFQCSNQLFVCRR